MHTADQNQRFPQEQQHHRKNQERVWGEVWAICTKPQGQIICRFYPSKSEKSGVQ